MRYTIAWAVTLDELEDEINDAIRDGWVLAGGVCGTEAAFYQAMVRYDNADREDG